MDIVTLDLENGNKTHFKKHPRYGTWSVNFDKGGIPAILSGEWQSFMALKQKTESYLRQRPKNKTKLKESSDA